MRGVHTMIMSIIGSLLVSLSPVVNATFADDAEFSANGQVAAALETVLQGYLLQQELNQVAFSVYQQGTSYGPDGNEYVSSSPEQDFVNRHRGGYCSPAIASEVKGFGCSALQGVTPEEAAYLAMGDVKFSVLLDPTEYTTALTYAAQNLIRTLTNPFPNPTIKKMVESANFMNSGSDKKKYAQYMANQAVLGVALYSMNEMYGMRVTGETLGLAGDAAGASIMSTMQSEASRRYMDSATFLAFLNDPLTDSTAVLKEMAVMQSFQMWMSYQQFRQSERVEALLAASLAKTVQTELQGLTMDVGM